MNGSAERPAAVAVSGIYARLVLVALFWGGTFIAGRIAAQELPPTIAAALRFFMAAPVLLFMAWKLEGGLPRLNRSQAAATFALGFCGIFVYNICFFSALSQMPAGRTALIVALNPIVTMLLLAILFRERFTARKWAAILIAFAGAAVIITRGDLAGAWRDIRESVGAGEALMFCAITGWAVYTILGRFALKGLTPLAATTYAVCWGAGLLGAAAVFGPSSIGPLTLTWQSWAAIAYLGLFGTVIGFIWYYEGVRAIGPSRAAVFNNLVPVFGVVLASAILGEPILASMIIGAALVIGGVTLANAQGK